MKGIVEIVAVVGSMPLTVVIVMILQTPVLVAGIMAAAVVVVVVAATTPALVLGISMIIIAAKVVGKITFANYPAIINSQIISDLSKLSFHVFIFRKNVVDKTRIDLSASNKKPKMLSGKQYSNIKPSLKDNFGDNLRQKNNLPHSITSIAHSY